MKEHRVYTPFPHQIDGAHFLATRSSALLADEPRVGKTGTAIMAADFNLEEKLLIITTASGRAVWKKAFKDWSPFDRDVQVLTKSTDKLKSASAIVGWGGITNPTIRTMLLSRKWDRIISDEDHFAKSFDAARTRALYGELHDGWMLNTSTALSRTASDRVWALTGTPQPNAPNDWYPRLRALRPESLRAHNGFPDVTKYQDFLHRYCVVRMKKISNFRKIPVVIGGRNLEELRERRGDFMLRRTQQDVGIRAPLYDILPLAVSPAIRREVEGSLDAAQILAAAEAGSTRELDMHLGPLRRLTGEIKARAVVDAVKEEFDCGLDKIVLAYWHRDVGIILKEGLSTYGVVGIDGSTSANKREENVARFADPHGPRVFLGQIEAAGEAVDLSPAATLWFVETVFSPKAMKQMSLRITNHTQTRQALIRVCALEGSIDEAMEEVLLRKWTAIREVLAA
jgi:SWI/SNF-related matrix-associated actin-dependent regulator 1 of chromatin subfamily A